MFETQLKVMLEMLDKKEQILMQILNISTNQETILLSGQSSDEINIFFNEMSAEKQNLIQEILLNDELFQNRFDTVKEEFDGKAPMHKALVAQLQAKIKEVMEIDAKIRIQEEKNKMHLGKSVKKNKIETTPKNYILKQYEKNNQFTGRDPHK